MALLSPAHSTVWLSARRASRLRLTLQLLLLGLAAAVVGHGLFGSPIAPRNLATVTVAVHWRGLLIGTLLLAGNLFCTSCPMVLVRDAGRRLVRPMRHWPSWARGKWLGLGLLVVVLFSYELFNLWELPRATAWVVLGYFASALLIDLTFTGASFCKFVCPIGQFNFVAATLSPREVTVRRLSTCATCETADCLKGRVTPEAPATVVQRGCELGLFLPMKVGNLDCTFCFDCVRACPHDNVTIASRVPGREWLNTGHRAGVGRVQQRRDLAALALVFVCAAPLNAALMTAPARATERWLADVMGTQALAPALAALFIAALVVVPAVLVTLTAVAAGKRPDASLSLVSAAIPYIYALVPLGVGGWASHYGFHLLTGGLTIVPVVQSAAIDVFGSPLLGVPLWSLAGIRPGAAYPIQLGLVLLGLAGSIGLIRATAESEHVTAPRRAAFSWIVLACALALAMSWIFAQPMDMRGLGTIG